MAETFTLHFDGGSRGNPGPAGIGVVICAADGTSLLTLGRFIGRCTNNVAEYRALITVMEEALKLGAKNVAIVGDSELVVRQMRGEYRVKNANLRELYEKAIAIFHRFSHATIEHKYREQNSMADRLANLAMDRKCDVTDVEESPVESPAPLAPRPGDRANCPRCGCEIEITKPSRLYPHQLKPFRCQCGNPMG